jgi:hypothetical protein
LIKVTPDAKELPMQTFFQTLLPTFLALTWRIEKTDILCADGEVSIKGDKLENQ